MYEHTRARTAAISVTRIAQSVRISEEYLDALAQAAAYLSRRHEPAAVPAAVGSYEDAMALAAGARK